MYMLSAILAMVLAWLVAYPAAARRAESSDQRLVLPLPQWLEDRCAANDALPVKLGKTDRVTFKCLGLLHLDAGVEYAGPLTIFNKEFFVLFQYFGRRRDAFSFRVKAATRVEPTFVTSCSSLASRHGTSNRHRSRIGVEVFLDLGHSVAYPTVDWLADQPELLAWAQRVQPGEALSGKNIPMLQVTSPIAELIMHGAWSEVMVLGRWFEAGRPGQQQVRLLRSFPSDRFWQNMSSDVDPPPEQCEFKAGHLRLLADQLRVVAQRLGEVEAPTADDVMGGDIDALASAVTALDGLAVMLDPRVESRDRWRAHPAHKAINGFIAAWHCRDKQGGLPHVIRHAVLTCWPGSFGQSLAQSLSDPRLPSKSSLQRWTLSFDVAAMRLRKARMQVAFANPLGVSIWLGADSSPQHGQDWFMSAYSWALNQDLPIIRASARALQDLPMEGLDERSKRAVSIRAKLRMHKLPALAVGDSSLAKKFEILMHGFSLECEPDDFQKLLNSTVSGTFDMGTEVGLVDFMAERAAQVFPEHLHAELDEDRPAAVEGSAADQDVTAPSSPYVFKTSVTVPGALHILHNAEKNLHEHMPFWKEHWLQVKQVLKLFCHSGHHRRFIAACVEGTRFAGLKPQLDVKIPDVLEARWSTVLQGLRRLSNLEVPLTMAWSPEKWNTRSGYRSALLASFNA